MKWSAELTEHLMYMFQGTVLIKNADELMSFSKGEESLMEEVRKF